MFAVVDVETTGGHPSGHAITEIAIVIHNGNSILDHYTTLLNPGQAIPLNIQALTGITPDMVADAPTFEEKHEEIAQILGDHIFVAHNVNFDLGFIQHAFKQVGVQYNPKRLCSVRYARRVEKGLRSYSLKNLCHHFNITNDAAHRAWGDAEATAHILGILLAKDREGQWQQMIKRNQGELNLPPNLPAKEYHQLPERPGVYYFYNQKEQIIYIGKARNLKRRVASHFGAAKSTKRSQAFKREIYHIHYELTGSELGASLLEDHEIRHHWPIYNKAQKKPKQRFGVFHYKNQDGNWSLVVNRLQKQRGYLMQFFTLHEAQSWLLNQVKSYDLNPAYCGLTRNYLPENSTPNHNKNFEAMVAQHLQREENYLLKTPGRDADEEGFIWVQNGQLKGLGFVGRHEDFDPRFEIADKARLLRNSVTTASLLRRVQEEEKYPMVPLPKTLEQKDGLLF